MNCNYYLVYRYIYIYINKLIVVANFPVLHVFMPLFQVAICNQLTLNLTHAKNCDSENLLVISLI